MKLVKLLLHAFVLIMEALGKHKQSKLEDAVREDDEAIDNSLDAYLADNGLLDDEQPGESDQGDGRQA